MDNAKFIDDFMLGVGVIANNISREEISKTIDMLFQAWQHGNKVFLVGNGGSASTATHLACDLNKVTSIAGQKRMKAISLVDNIPLVSALTNDDGWENVYVEQLRNLFEPGDVVLGISVHGGKGQDKAGAWSQNLMKALQYAIDNGGKALGLSGFDGGQMRELADVCIVVPYNTTPHVESFHAILHHLIAFCLAEKIRRHAESSIS
ncbi:MAG: SIS domain-containing protein [Planctomycetota bacterium]